MSHLESDVVKAKISEEKTIPDHDYYLYVTNIHY